MSNIEEKTINEQGETEVKVQTVDYRSPAGQDDKLPVKENVEIIHIMTDKSDLDDSSSGTTKNHTSESGKNEK